MKRAALLMAYLLTGCLLPKQSYETGRILPKGTQEVGGFLAISFALSPEKEQLPNGFDLFSTFHVSGTLRYRRSLTAHQDFGLTLAALELLPYIFKAPTPLQLSLGARQQVFEGDTSALLGARLIGLYHYRILSAHRRTLETLTTAEIRTTVSHNAAVVPIASAYARYSVFTQDSSGYPSALLAASPELQKASTHGASVGGALGVMIPQETSQIFLRMTSDWAAPLMREEQGMPWVFSARAEGARVSGAAERD